VFGMLFMLARKVALTNVLFSICKYCVTKGQFVHDISLHAHTMKDDHKDKLLQWIMHLP
jgi:hypothetical protein